MAREIPESEVATMEALVKCGVIMVSIALAYQHIEQENRAKLLSKDEARRIAANIAKPPGLLKR